MLVSIIGGGQLGRMLALAGYPLGLRFRVLDPAEGASAGQLAEQIVGPYADQAALERLADGAAVVTYEFENVPVEAAERIAQTVPVFPPPAALEAAQDRLAEKRFFQSLGVPTPSFAPVDSRADLQAALAQLGAPAVLKTRRLGYDGKGQVVLRDVSEADAAWDALGGQPLILEGFVPFRRELSIIAARGRSGEVVCYPLVENHHRDGILRRSLAPAPGMAGELQTEAERIAGLALDALGYVGVLAIELFELGSDTPGAVESRLLVNEMAPRVHNSGHWTTEGAVTSQFENHLRAILGLPLGSAAPRGHSAMINLIGALPDTQAVLAIPGAHLHLYGKSPRPGRKVGHITVCADDSAALAERAAAVERLVAEALP